MVRNATIEDVPEICDIYNYYILNSHATFETEPISTSEMQQRINRVAEEFALPWLVYESEKIIQGYAYATQWKARAAYAQTAETTVYLHRDHFGKGLGTKLYQALLDELKRLNYHSILGGIALPNDGSIALHEKMGYRKVGHLKEVGFKFDRWVDVAYWQILLDK